MDDHRIRLNHIRALFISTLLLVLAGCIAIPTPEHALLAGHGKITNKDLAPFKVGTTTREDVLLSLGEPDTISPDENIMTYWWRVISGYFCVAAPFSGGYSGPFLKDYLLMFEFDPQSRLMRFTRSASYTLEQGDTLEGPELLTHEPGAKIYQKAIVITFPLCVCRVPVPEGRIPSTPVRFQVGAFRFLPADQGTRIGHRDSSRGIPAADLVLLRPPADVVRALVIAQLEAAGHQLVFSNADVSVTCDIAEFSVTDSVGAYTWEGHGSLDVTLLIKAHMENSLTITRHYRARHVRQRDALRESGLSTKPFDEVVRMCLQDMQAQMANDTELADLSTRLRLQK